MGLGLAMWLVSQVMWTYFEVYLRHEAPNPFVGDVILFLHIVPMMAAVAIQPHVEQDDRSLRVGTLDFALLLAWWLFLYLFIVIPWQYVYPVEAVYGRSFDLLYVCEELVLTAGLLLVWRRSRGAWRSIYFHLCGATLLYCVASLVGQRSHRSAPLLHRQFVRRSAGGRNGVVCPRWFPGARDRDSKSRRGATHSELWDLESTTRDGGGLYHPADGGMGAIWRRCAAVGPYLPVIADRGCHGCDGRAGVCEAASARPGVAELAAILASEPG